MEEFKSKVIASLDALTEAETDIIILGASYDRSIPKSGTNVFWHFDLLDDEYQLARQVRELLANDYNIEVNRRVYIRARAFD